MLGLTETLLMVVEVGDELPQPLLAVTEICRFPVLLLEEAVIIRLSCPAVICQPVGTDQV